MIAPIACALFLALSLFGEARDNLTLRGIGKTLASLMFILWAVQLGLPSRGVLGQTVTAALVLSAIGDVALLSTEKRWFLGGLVAFLLAHVAYAAGFMSLAPSLAVTLATSLCMCGLVVVIWRWLAPHTGSLKPAVAAYIAVISVMVVLAAGVAGADPSTGRIGLAVSAVVFMISDLFVARQRFVHPSHLNRYIGLPLYYMAQLAFVWAASEV